MRHAASLPASDYHLLRLLLLDHCVVLALCLGEHLGDEGELAQYAIKGSDADWDAALASGKAPKHVSVKRAAGDANGKKKKRESSRSDGSGKKRKSR